MSAHCPLVSDPLSRRWIARPWLAACGCAVSLGTALSLAAPALAADAASAATRAALTVTVVQAQPAVLAQTVAANGSIAAWQEAIVSAEANGWRLAEVRVNVGDRVKRGQVMAVLGTELAQADMAQQRAAVAEAEATLAEATANAQRARDLQPTGVLSAQQTNQILTVERTAQARLEAQRAAYRAQQVRLNQAQVKAPDDGVVSARSATVGAVVPAGQELFRLIRQGRLEWRAEVAATELGRLQPGQTVRVLPNGAAPLTGQVRIVGPTVDAATRNGLVYVDLPGAAAGAVKAGMFARGEFDIGSGNALTLPQTAVLLRDGFAYVYRVGPDNKARQTKVSVGRRAGERIEITAGLEANARVVAQGAGFLADGDTVRVVAAPVPTAPKSIPPPAPMEAPTASTSAATPAPPIAIKPAAATPK
jgi:HlyD family secretion protein